LEFCWILSLLNLIWLLIVGALLSSKPCWVESRWTFLHEFSWKISAKTLCNDLGLDDMYASLPGLKYRPQFLAISLLLSG